MSSEELAYIEKRSEELANYSDKLRSAFYSITDVFGDGGHCQICDGVKKCDAHYKFGVIPAQWTGNDDYTNELPAGKTAFETREESRKDLAARGKLREEDAYYKTEYNHDFVAKIECNCGEIIGEVVLGQITDIENNMKDEYRLALIDNEITFVRRFNEAEEWSAIAWNNIGRKLIKEAVRQKAFEKLVKQIKGKLDEMSTDYKSVSEIAGKLADAL